FVITFLLTATTLAVTYLKNIRLKARQSAAAAGGYVAGGTTVNAALDKAASFLGQPPANVMEVSVEQKEATIGDWREQAKAEESMSDRSSRDNADANDRLRDGIDGEDGKRGV